MQAEGGAQGEARNEEPYAPSVRHVLKGSEGLIRPPDCLALGVVVST